MTAFIYALTDPITSECRYVGKTCDPQSRMYGHMSDFRSRTRKSMWVRSLQKQGMVPEFCVLEVVPKKDWADSERFWIAYFRFLGARLTNATHGGEGGDFTPEIKAKLSIKAVAQWSDPSKRPSRGPATIEHRRRKSEARKKLLSDPTKRALLLTQLDVVRNSPRRLQNLKLATQRPEVKAKLQASMAAWRSANPDAVKAHALKMHTAEAKANCDAAKKREDVRRKMSESAKKRWQRDRDKIIAAQNIGKRKKSSNPSKDGKSTKE